MIKAKYYVIEPYYMEDSTPDGPVLFSGSPHSILLGIPLALLVGALTVVFIKHIKIKK